MALFDSLTSLFSSRVNVAKRFALLREAISGTMSKFYMARDLRTGKVVGLKILDIEKTAALELRYKGLNKPPEGAIAMQLHHPHIVETYEHGMTTEGAPYIVMEFLEGADLNSLVVGRDPRLDGHRLRFLREIAEAIAAVHDAGFIHRDVCPRNFLFDKESEHLKLIDFGVTVPATPPFMQPGVRTGNPNYMAPEVVRRRPIDQRLDVFAYGVTAYELCAFQLPWFRGTTGLAAMTHDRPPADLRTVRPEIDPKLAKAIHWCLESEPAKRCPSLERLLKALKDVKGE